MNLIYMENLTCKIQNKESDPIDLLPKKEESIAQFDDDVSFDDYINENFTSKSIYNNGDCDKIPPSRKRKISTIKVQCNSGAKYHNDVYAPPNIVNKVPFKKTAEIKIVDFVDDEIDMKPKAKTSRPKPNKIPADMKKMIIDSLENGVLDRKSAATAFNLPYATIVTIYKKFLQTGAVGRKKKDEKIQDEQLQFILDTLAKNCTYTIKEITEMVKSKYDLDVHYVSVSKKIPAFHYNLNRVQRSDSCEASKDIINEHKEFCKIFLEYQNANRTVIYFDETEFNILMRRFCGRTEPGSQKHGQSFAPSLRTRHRTLIVAMTNEKVLLYKALEKTRTRADLMQYMKDLLGVLEEEKVSGGVIFVGSTVREMCEDIRGLLEAEGHMVVCMPKHSESLNPVEGLFGQWPSIVRGKEPKNEAGLEEMIGSLAGVMSKQQCNGFVGQATDNARRCVADS